MRVLRLLRVCKTASFHSVSLGHLDYLITTCESRSNKWRQLARTNSSFQSATNRDIPKQSLSGPHSLHCTHTLTHTVFNAHSPPPKRDSLHCTQSLAKAHTVVSQKSTGRARLTPADCVSKIQNQPQASLAPSPNLAFSSAHSFYFIFFSFSLFSSLLALPPLTCLSLSILLSVS